MSGLYDRYLGPRWRDFGPGIVKVWERASNIPDEELWRTHERLRSRLIAFARRQLREQLIQRGAPGSEIDGASEVLDPEALTIGFARRFATYKRATLLFRDFDRLKRILGNHDYPVQIILAGKAHPLDNAGKDLIRQVIHFARDPLVRRRIVFLEDYSMSVARGLDQLGGAPKAYEVSRGFWRFIWTAPYLLVAALLVYLVYLRWPRVGRALLVMVPLALWRAGQHAMLDSAGFVIIYALMAPYLYLFVPRGRREAGAKLLYWVWVPALLAGAMTAFTSAAAYLNSAVGLLPALIASGLFLAWALEAATGEAENARRAAAHLPLAGDTRSRRLPWLAMVALVGVVAATLAFQFQFQQREVAYGSLTKRCDFGPWWGIKVMPEREIQLRTFARDLMATSSPDDELLVFYQSPGFYLFWPGGIAANSYWLSSPDTFAPLPQTTVDSYRRNRMVPTLAVHLMVTAGMTAEEITAACGGLGYPPVLVRPWFAMQRKPAGESTAEVLDRLPRE